MAPTLDALLRTLPPEALFELPVPQEFARVAHAGTGAAMHTRRIALGPRAELRAVHLHGPRAELLNVLVWPAPRTRAPVFALEAVVLGGRPAIVVVDLKGFDPVTRDQSLSRWRTLRTMTTLPPIAPDVPVWYADCRSGEDIFVRPATSEEFHTCLDAALELWRASLPLWLQAPTDPVADSDVLHYKTHHCAHQPGRPFLQRLFGADWTERYLATVLYA